MAQKKYKCHWHERVWSVSIGTYFDAKVKCTLYLIPVVVFIAKKLNAKMKKIFKQKQRQNWYNEDWDITYEINN